MEQLQKGKVTVEEESFFTQRRRRLTQSRKKKDTLEGKMEELNFEKKLNALMKMKADEKKDYEAQIEKINLELAELKLKNVDLRFENDCLRVEYNNFIKTVADECKKRGIKLIVNDISS